MFYSSNIYSEVFHMSNKAVFKSQEQLYVAYIGYHKLCAKIYIFRNNRLLVSKSKNYFIQKPKIFNMLSVVLKNK